MGRGQEDGWAAGKSAPRSLSSQRGFQTCSGVVKEEDLQGLRAPVLPAADNRKPLTDFQEAPL